MALLQSLEGGQLREFAPPVHAAVLRKVVENTFEYCSEVFGSTQARGGYESYLQICPA
jgi:hypothetical protein